MIDRSPHYLLNGIAGWRAASLKGATVDGGCLQLQLMPGTPLPLTDSSGTFGGLQNPTGIAVDSQERIYVLDAGSCTLLRYDRCSHHFVKLPCIGPQGCEPRQLRSPHGIFISCADDIYIADTGNRRVQIFSCCGLALRRIWEPMKVTYSNQGITTQAVSAAIKPSATGDCDCAASYPEGTWQPWDVAVSSRGWAYVSDYANGLIHVFDPRGCWHTAFTGQGEHTSGLSKPTRLTLDGKGNIYILQEGNDTVVIMTEAGKYLRTVSRPGELTGEFCPAAVAIDAAGNLCVGDSVSRATYTYPQGEGCCECVCPSFANALVFDASGHAIYSDGTQILCQLPESSYSTSGMYFSSALDSKTYRCVWHRVALSGRVPAGSAVRVDVFTSEALKTDDEISGLPQSRWSTGQVDTDTSGNEWDCLIQAAAGRYLWIRLTLTGYGSVTPSLSRVRVYFPRASSIKYLPAAYRADPTSSSDFLSRFLSIFDSLRAPISDQITDMAALFDPMATPAGSGRSDFLGWLASWLGLSLQANWSLHKRRELVRQAHRLYKLRGTPAGLRLHIELYAGVQPQILELFRLRRWLFVSGATLGNDSTLFGNSVMNRLQVGVNSGVGSFQLFDHGDPSLDVFNKYAYRFLVSVPQWHGAGQAEQLALQQIIEMAKPAHTLAEFRWAQPRLRIGQQSYVGVDTVIAAYPSGVIEGQGKLGFDTVLSGSLTEREPSMQVGRRSVIGCNTSLQ